MYVCPGKKIIIYILKNMADDKKIIFSMVGVSKTFPPQKQVLKNIYLSFFYGGKDRDYRPQRLR